MSPSTAPQGPKRSKLVQLLDLPTFLLSVFVMYWSLPIGALTTHIRFWRTRSLRDDMFGWSKMLVSYLNVRVLHLGGVQPYRASPCVYLCNHRSWADFFVDTYLTEGRAALMSRLAVAWVFPVFMMSCHLIGGVILFKRGAVVDKEKFNARIDSKLANSPVHSLLVYPEGHRSTAPESLELKRGMLRYAYSRKLPVQVVIAAGKEALLSEKQRTSRWGRTIVVVYSEVMRTSDFPTFDEFVTALQTSWDAAWKGAYSTPTQGIPTFKPVGMAYDYSPALRLTQGVWTALSVPLFLALMLWCWRQLTWMLMATGPARPVFVALLVSWAAASLWRACQPDSQAHAQAARPQAHGPVPPPPALAASAGKR